MLPWILCIILAAGLLVLSVRLLMLRRDLAHLAHALEQRLKTDTNTPLRLRSGDRHLRRFTAILNQQLDLLREQQMKYVSGDRELKNAVTNISHDLRTPLTAISGYLELLSDQVQTADAKRYLAVIENRTEQMRQLTEELFRYSLILSSEGEPETETVSINALLEESIAGYYAVLMQRGITPQIDLPAQPVYCKCNPSALSRVFTNLLHNALKYSSGDLFISADESGTVCFANHAAEIDKTHLAHLFDRFYTVESAEHSTGLGLAIAKTVMEQMGGSIEASCEDDLLTIRLHLPETA